MDAHLRHSHNRLCPWGSGATFTAHDSYRAMKPVLKTVLIASGVLILTAMIGVGGYVYAQTAAFDESVARIYDIPVPPVEASKDPEAISRGKHLAHSLGGCAVAECHGSALAGGKVTQVGPLGTLGAPNITPAGMGAVYSDGELMRLIEHGVKKDGTTALFMTSHEINWLPQSDILAIIAYVRTVAPVDKPGASSEVGVLGKVLDRRNEFAWDVARRIDHEHIDKAPPPSPTAEYGRHIAKLCMGCHGESLGGGPIPGAPPEIPIPSNITPHESGISGWTYEDFEKLLDTGIRKNGKKLNPFMPLSALAAMDETERRALFSFLMSLPAKPMGSR